MKNYFLTDDGVVGFGASREEAKIDLYMNKCRLSLKNDVQGKYTARRDELSPWLPTPYMLHISTVGCLLYENNCITEVRSNRKVQITIKGTSIFYYLAILFGNKLSYEDITIVAREEIDEFFTNISEEFTPIIKTPLVKCANDLNGFEPKSVFLTSNNVIIGVADREIGLKGVKDDFFYTVDLNEQDGYVPLLSYVGYRRGIIITDTKVEV